MLDIKDKIRLQELAHKWLKGSLTVEEQQEFDLWFKQVHDNPLEVPEVAALDEQSHERALFAKIQAELGIIPQRKTIKLWPRIIGVAAAVAAIVFGVWFYTSRHLEGSEASRDLLNYANDISPGKNTATLTLANGKVVPLSDTKTGVVVGSELKYNDGTAINTTSTTPPVGHPSLAGGELQGANSKVQMLTATTPRGGTYQVVLPDKSKVWLNADSKISFPSQFIGKERKILLLYGEAYFEVAKNKQKPFIVDAGRQKISVLGTHFNVNAYREEQAMKTTLLEGRVKIEDSGVSKVLTPGTQAYSGSDGLRIVTVNVNDIIDWKNGDFVFKGETLENIMRKVARWYNVQVVYAPDAPKTITLGGYVSRSRNISAVLELMERTGKVKFKVSGTTITVTK